MVPPNLRGKPRRSAPLTRGTPPSSGGGSGAARRFPGRGGLPAHHRAATLSALPDPVSIRSLKPLHPFTAHSLYMSSIAAEQRFVKGSPAFSEACLHQRACGRQKRERRSSGAVPPLHRWGLTVKPSVPRTRDPRPSGPLLVYRQGRFMLPVLFLLQWLHEAVCLKTCTSRPFASKPYSFSLLTYEVSAAIRMVLYGTVLRFREKLCTIRRMWEGTACL